MRGVIRDWTLVVLVFIGGGMSLYGLLDLCEENARLANENSRLTRELEECRGGVEFHRSFEPALALCGVLGNHVTTVRPGDGEIKPVLILPPDTTD